jgi:four helix bundle protein
MEKQQQAAGDGQQETGDRRQERGRLRKGDDIAERLLALGVQIVRLLRALPRDPAGKHLAIQLFRCATSPGANYEEARAAESRADFAHKASIAAKEMRETRFWLELLHRSGWLKQDLMHLVNEARELSAILGASVRTARVSSR